MTTARTLVHGLIYVWLFVIGLFVLAAFAGWIRDAYRNSDAVTARSCRPVHSIPPE